MAEDLSAAEADGFGRLGLALGYGQDAASDVLADEGRRVEHDSEEHRGEADRHGQAVFPVVRELALLDDVGAHGVEWAGCTVDVELVSQNFEQVAAAVEGPRRKAGPADHQEDDGQ